MSSSSVTVGLTRSETDTVTGAQYSTGPNPLLSPFPMSCPPDVVWYALLAAWPAAKAPEVVSETVQDNDEGQTPDQ